VIEQGAEPFVLAVYGPQVYVLALNDPSDADAKDQGRAGDAYRRKRKAESVGNDAPQINEAPRHASQLRPVRAVRPRRQCTGAGSLQRLLAGIASLVSTRLGAGAGEALPELAPQVTQLLLGPYVGSEQARRVAGRAGRPCSRCSYWRVR
jgi:hypothetical protein